MGLRAGLDWCGKSRPTGIRSPDRPARSSVAIPTELPGPPKHSYNIEITHNPSGRTMALGLSQPLTEMSTRNISWGVKAAGA